MYVTHFHLELYLIIISMISFKTKVSLSLFSKQKFLSPIASRKERSLHEKGHLTSNTPFPQQRHLTKLSGLAPRWGYWGWITNPLSVSVKLRWLNTALLKYASRAFCSWSHPHFVALVQTYSFLDNICVLLRILMVECSLFVLLP